MKRLILTHPLTGNYGGLLQAYALYKVLDELGEEPYIFRYEPNDFSLSLKSKYYYLKHYVKYFFGFGRNMVPHWSHLSVANSFTASLRSIDEKQLSKINEAYSFVVGSDQVWRASYCRSMKSPGYYFLNFTTTNTRLKSIAYSASFGIDEWEGNQEETRECVKLLRDFKAVSVREHSGILICDRVLGKKSEQMPDPTLLLSQSDYDVIISNSKTWLPEKKYIAYYLIDETPQLQDILESLSIKKGLYLQSLLPHVFAKCRRDRFYLSVAQWLRLIRDCEYFVTDSFHGCVFALIFNKPFICLGNNKRGDARFNSLFESVGWDARLMNNSNMESVVEKLDEKIDWKKINEIVQNERDRGKNFLKVNVAE